MCWPCLTCRIDKGYYIYKKLAIKHWDHMPDCLDTVAAVFVVIPPGGEDKNVMYPYAVIADPWHTLSGTEQLDCVAAWAKPPPGSEALMWTRDRFDNWHKIVVERITTTQFKVLALGEYSKQLPPGYSAPPEPAASDREDSAVMRINESELLKYDLRGWVDKHQTTVDNGWFDERTQALFDCMLDVEKQLEDKKQEADAALERRAAREPLAPAPEPSEKSIALARHINAVHSCGLPSIRVNSNIILMSRRAGHCAGIGCVPFVRSATRNYS
jgi:hypothetical protein